jgi:hypothetical protein
MEDEARDDQAPYRAWCLVELMGHRRMVGLVTEVEMGGSKLFRCDRIIPDEPDNYATVHFGAAAIYTLTDVSEEIAREMARRDGDPRPRRPAEFLPAIEHKPLEVDREAFLGELESTDADDQNFPF